MPSNTSQTSSSEMTEILNQNLETAEQIKATADELDVVHAVLSTQIPSDALNGDLQSAVERTDQLEQKLQETAEALEKSNEQLQRHLAEESDK
jgi:RNAse (barnase) inhibitor barstar